MRRIACCLSMRVWFIRMLHNAQIQLDGRTVGYATDGQGPPLLLLHGALFDHQLWAPMIPFLVGHFRVIALDLPGYGRSDPLRRKDTPDTTIRLVASVMSSLKIVPSLVVGLGSGGALALGLAARHPERVRGVVVMGALGIERWPQTFQIQTARRLRSVPGALSLALRFTARWQARWFLRSALGDSSPQPQHIAQLRATLGSASARLSLVRALRQRDEWRFVMRQIGGILAPTLLLWGERDALYDLSAAERLRHAIPNAQLVTLAGAGHLLPIERPEENAQLIRRFFAPLFASPTTLMSRTR